eukprot:6207555-Pleurochrysis_carterae.AAC.1
MATSSLTLCPPDPPGSGAAPPNDLQKCTEQPSQGRARSELVASTDSYRPHMPEQGVLYLFDSLLRDLPERPSGAAGANERGGWGTPDGWLKKGAHWAAAAIASGFIQELGERSASAPQVRMRCKSKTANCACAC